MLRTLKGVIYDRPLLADALLYIYIYILQKLDATRLLRCTRHLDTYSWSQLLLYAVYCLVCLYDGSPGDYVYVITVGLKEDSM